MENKRQKEAINFVEYMSTTIEVECQANNCDVVKGAWCEDEVSFAKELQKKGWRISVKGTLYCPKCAKKYLK